MREGVSQAPAPKRTAVRGRRARRSGLYRMQTPARAHGEPEGAVGNSDRVSALEGIEDSRAVAVKDVERGVDKTNRSPVRVTETDREGHGDAGSAAIKIPEPALLSRQKRIEMDLELRPQRVTLGD